MEQEVLLPLHIQIEIRVFLPAQIQFFQVLLQQVVVKPEMMVLLVVVLVVQVAAEVATLLLEQVILPQSVHRKEMQVVADTVTVE